ncbi:MAG: M1 family aminopeptidase [Xanthomonadales bacterium]|nr:M1 family aminopeptidase [Xanthomonadales bacterium]
MRKVTIALCNALFSLAILAACSKSDSSGQVVSETAPGTESSVSGEGAAPAFEDSDIPLARLDQPVEPVHYRLELRIDPREEQFSGSVSIDLQADEAMDGMWIHGNGLEVSEAWLEDKSGNRVNATYEQVHTSGVARLVFEGVAGPGEVILNMRWTATFNPRPNALFRVERGGHAYVASQFQPIAAREAFPGFDEPGFKVPFDITLITPTGDVTITNTPERSAEDLGDGFTRHVFETSRPLPTYLLAFAVGPYDLVDFGEIPPNDVRQRGLPLRAIAARGQGDKLHYALENTAGILEALEVYFGTEYPFRKLDLIAMPTSFGGAMENAGAVTYDEYLLLMEEDASLDQRRAYTAVHAHELGHMWFGDLVTPEWWTDIWLNESFATWIMYKASHEYWPDGEFDRQTMKGALAAMSNDSLAAARQIREPVTHNDAIGDAFDGITYQKGGGVLAMLERFTGEAPFREGIRLHMDRHAEGVADAADFIDSVAEGTGQPEIEAAFNSFIEQPGVPLLEISVNCDAGQPPTLEVRQSRYAPLGSTIDPETSQWLVPMCVSYQDGKDRRSECAMLRERQQSVALDSGDCPAYLHPNADGAGYYRFAMDESWWQGLVSGLSAMPASEALSMAESLDAAFRAGSVSAATYVEGMSALIDHETWDVVEAGIDNLEQIGNILTPAEMTAAQAAFRNLARPRYDRLAGESGDTAELLKSRLQRFLLIIARDPELRAPLAEQAARRIGLDGEPDPSAIPESELETALSIGVQDLGAPFFERLLEMAMASEDRAFRNDAFGALSRTEDPELAARLQEVILSGQLQGYEPLGILGRQMLRAATTELTYNWLRENFDAVVELIPEMFRGQYVAGQGSSFCSAERAVEWAAFVEANAELLPGYERSLAQAVESANLCAALRSAKASELLAALADA